MWSPLSVNLVIFRWRKFQECVSCGLGFDLYAFVDVSCRDFHIGEIFPMQNSKNTKFTPKRKFPYLLFMTEILLTVM